MPFKLPDLEEHGQLRRNAGVFSLLLISITSMIGSGWLFGAYHAAQIAGPLAVWSWVIGAVIILLIALCFAELSALFPRSGALVHMSSASHGQTLGHIWGWMLWLSYVATPAIEATAVVTYANNYYPHFVKGAGDHTLTTIGLVASGLLVSVFALLNMMAVRALLRFNNAITIWKVIVPIITIFALLWAGRSTGNAWTAGSGTYSVSGVFTALPLAGIVFSLLGFRTAIDLAGETANPGRSLPIAVVGSVVLVAIIYVFLQIAFISALDPAELKNGWGSLTFTGSTGPFAGLAATLGLTWLAVILYADAVVSPAGTGLAFVTGGSRILYAVGDTRGGPSILARVNEDGVPWVAVGVMWIAGIVFLLPFPAWQLLVGYISSITVLTYGLGPVALLVLRKSLPEANRRFSLPFAEIIAPVAFVASNLIIYWTGYYTNSILFGIIGVGFVLYAGYYHLVLRAPSSDFGWRNIAWLLPWFAGMWALSALGTTGNGYGVVGFWTGTALVAVWSVVVLWLALRAALDSSEVLNVMQQYSSDPEKTQQETADA